MITRHWRCLARAECADEYVSYLRTETFPALKEVAGFLEARVLSRPFANGVEFVVVTHWTELDAIHAFAGPDVEAAVVPAMVIEMMIEYDEQARHYDIVA